jgi:hypothetical protein
MLLAMFQSRPIRNRSVRKTFELGGLCPNEGARELEILLHRMPPGEVTQSPGAFGEHGFLNESKLRDGRNAAGKHWIRHSSVRNR